MKLPRVSSFLLCLALFALLLPPADAAVQWTSSTRLAGSEVIVTNATEFAVDTDNSSMSTFGLFVSSTLADTTVTGVLGRSTSEQFSDLHETGFNGTGAFNTTTEVTDPEGFADVFGGSILDVYFDVDTPTSFSLIGSITSGGGGTAGRVALHGPGGFILNEQPAPGTTIPIDASGLLEPGSYLVIVSVNGNAQEAPPNLAVSASGEWEMTFLLGGATTVAVSAPAEEFRIFPNPARGHSTISLATRANTRIPVRVLDAAGRLVRSLETTSGSVAWDTRDAAGRPVPAGVYFVAARREGRLTTGRVTVLR